MKPEAVMVVLYLVRRPEVNTSKSGVCIQAVSAGKLEHYSSMNFRKYFRYTNRHRANASSCVLTSPTQFVE